MEGSACDINTGVCRCKQYVTGSLCDRCATGFQMLEASNPRGCSAGNYNGEKETEEEEREERGGGRGGRRQ